MAAAKAQTAENVLLVVNRRSAESRAIGDYYQQKRAIPSRNVCAIDTAVTEDIAREIYGKQIETPVGECLRTRGLTERVLYIVLTMGIPLRIGSSAGKSAQQSDGAAVDSELTLLYQKMRGVKIPLDGPIPNPFFRQRDTPFRHPTFPMYLVTRLDAWTVSEVKGMIDRALLARNVGRFAIDLKGYDGTGGNQWLRTAALLLRKGRVVLEETPATLENVADVIGYASGARTTRPGRTGMFTWAGCRGRLRRSSFPPMDAVSASRPMPGRWGAGKMRNRGGSEVRKRWLQTTSMRGPAGLRGRFLNRFWRTVRGRILFCRPMLPGEIWQRVSTWDSRQLAG